MAPRKNYELVTINKRRTKAQVRDTSTSQPIFKLDLSFLTEVFKRSKQGQHSIIMRAVDPGSGTAAPDSPIIGTCDLTFSSITTPIHLAIGDPDSAPETVVWEDLTCGEKWKMSGFELNIDLGGKIGRRTFAWKRTHDIEGVGLATKKFSVFHMKLVDVETGAVVARFAHHLIVGSKRGRFEFEDFDGGEYWEKIVILSGTAVLEYSRKALGWSF